MENTIFPLQRSNELVIQFSNTLPDQQQHKISEDQILDDYASLVVNDSADKIFSISSTSRQPKLHVNSNDHEKKMVHREIERLRRQEMATYCASLRSLLPLEFIKGKRSTSDHMNEARNYIKYMQNNIKLLSTKRDELKKLSNSKLEKLENKQTSCKFSVRENNGILGIEITSGGLREEKFKLSELLQLLLQEGYEVISCISTEFNGRLLHSFQCEVKNSKSVDLFELRKKIAYVIPTLTCCD